jgi:hypothetical protein
VTTLPLPQPESPDALNISCNVDYFSDHLKTLAIDGMIILYWILNMF